MATYDEKLVDGKALDQLSVGIYNKLKQKIDEKPNTTVTGGKGVTVSKSVDDYTINIVSANTGITINDDNIQLNVVNDVTSGGVEKPLSAEQGKILKQKIDEKEPKINIKNSGFNLNKSDEINLDDSNTLATSKSVKLAYDKGVEAINSIGDKLNKGSLPSSVSDAKSIYDLIENNSGLNFDTALLYLNDAGTKAKGKVYFDRNKKGMFECIKETTGTVNSTEFFVDISNKSSSDRLTNLGNNYLCYSVSHSREYLYKVNESTYDIITKSPHDFKFKIKKSGTYKITGISRLSNAELQFFLNDNMIATKGASDESVVADILIIEVKTNDTIRIQLNSEYGIKSSTFICEKYSV